jgi:hypothetical protein
MLTGRKVAAIFENCSCSQKTRHMMVMREQNPKMYRQLLDGAELARAKGSFSEKRSPRTTDRSTRGVRYLGDLAIVSGRIGARPEDKDIELQPAMQWSRKNPRNGPQPIAGASPGIDKIPTPVAVPAINPKGNYARAGSVNRASTSPSSTGTGP